LPQAGAAACRSSIPLTPPRRPPAERSGHSRESRPDRRLPSRRHAKVPSRQEAERPRRAEVRERHSATGNRRESPVPRSRLAGLPARSIRRAPRLNRGTLLPTRDG
jgi:hypothetical protein